MAWPKGKDKVLFLSLSHSHCWSPTITDAVSSSHSLAGTGPILLFSQVCFLPLPGTSSLGPVPCLVLSCLLALGSSKKVILCLYCHFLIGHKAVWMPFSVHSLASDRRLWLSSNLIDKWLEMEKRSFWLFSKGAKENDCIYHIITSVDSFVGLPCWYFVYSGDSSIGLPILKGMLLCFSHTNLSLCAFFFNLIIFCRGFIWQSFYKLFITHIWE